MKTFRSFLALAAYHAAGVDAFWRMECQGRVGLGRMDPLVAPGAMSQHVHTIFGSSGFGLSTTYEDLMNGDCTSCRVLEDKSAYWHPALYFQDEDTKQFELAPQIGGMLAYYKLNNLTADEKLTAFPEGFRMIAGESPRRTFGGPGDPSKADPAGDMLALGLDDQARRARRATGFNCLNYARDPEPALLRHVLPDKAFLDANCRDGLRFEMQFPSCWNGRDIDTPNHKDHMAYPVDIGAGACPEGFPVKTPSLMFESIWDTNKYNGRRGRFVIANGDPIGFGYHGDYIQGWPKGFLQQAVDRCTAESGRIEDCPLFTLQSEDQARKCQMKLPAQVAAEDVLGPVSSLPGNVPITYEDGSSEGGSPAPVPDIVGAIVPVPSPEPTIPGAGFKESEPAAPPPPPPPPASEVKAAEVPTPEPEPVAPPPPPPPPPAPSTTAPPVEPPPPAETKSFYSTQTVKEGNLVKVIYWEEETVYVTDYEDTTTTVTVTASSAPNKQKRRLHHQHGHRHHI